MGRRVTVLLGVLLSALVGSVRPSADVTLAKLMATTLPAHPVAGADPGSFVPTTIDRQPAGDAPSGSFRLGAGRAGEVASLRTRTSDTYATGKGAYEAHVYPWPVNFRDASGRWQPIDDTLRPARAAGYAVQNRANRYAVYLPSELGTAPVRVAAGNSWVTFALEGGHGRGRPSGNSDTFEDALPGASITLQATADAVKESVLLANPSASSTLTYVIETSSGLTPKSNRSGGIDFFDPGGAVQFSFAPPTIHDSSGLATGVSRAVTMKLLTQGGRYLVTVAADRGWLLDPSRRWPVVIDPTVTLPQATQDCYLVGGSHAGTSYCGGSTLEAGYDGTEAMRTLLQFNVQGAISSQMQVLDAQLNMYLYGESTTSTVPVSAYGLTRAWTAGASWNTYDGTNAWTTPGGDVYPTPAGTHNKVGGALGWYSWFLPGLVQGWVNGTKPNHGVLLREQTENVVNTLQFDSSESSNPAYWPYLNVTYQPWMGEQRFQKLETMNLTGPTCTCSIKVKTNVANGNLEVHQHDLTIKGTGLDLNIDRYYNSLSPNTSDFGHRWVMGAGADVGLQIFGNGSADFNGPSGYQIPFEHQAGGTFAAPTGVDAGLVQNPGGTYTLSFNATGERYNFTSGGYLTSDVDKNGNTISYAYNPNNTLASITDTQGRVTTFGYNVSGFIITMTDPSGRLYQYGYDGDGNLTGYTDPAGKVTQYAYDSSHDLVQITDPLGNQTKVAYDAGGRPTSITRVTNPSTGTGYVTGFAYNVGSTIVTDPNRDQTTYNYDGDQGHRRARRQDLALLHLGQQRQPVRGWDGGHHGGHV